MSRASPSSRTWAAGWISTISTSGLHGTTADISPWAWTCRRKPSRGTSPSSRRSMEKSVRIWKSSGRCTSTRISIRSGAVRRFRSRRVSGARWVLELRVWPISKDSSDWTCPTPSRSNRSNTTWIWRCAPRSAPISCSGPPPSGASGGTTTSIPQAATVLHRPTRSAGPSPS